MACCTGNRTTCADAPRYTVSQIETTKGVLTWQIIKSGAKRFCASGLTNKEAVARGRELAIKNKGVLVVLSANGEVRSNRSYA